MRSGWDEHSVLSVMAQQATRSQRRAHADTVIHNDEIGLSELSDHVRKLWLSCVPAGALASSSRSRFRESLACYGTIAETQSTVAVREHFFARMEPP